MANQRIKGQEVEVSVLADGEIQLFTDINAFEMTNVTEIKEEGYLGEKADRYDEIYKGFTGSFKMHSSTGAILDFLEVIKDRAQRRTPSTVINIKATLAFPNGERRRIILSDCFFDASGVAFGSRDAYAETSVQFKGTDWRQL